MMSSSKNPTMDGCEENSAASTSFITEKISAVSDSMPIPPVTSAAPNASNRRVDPEATGLSDLADNESEGATRDTE